MRKSRGGRLAVAEPGRGELRGRLLLIARQAGRRLRGEPVIDGRHAFDMGREQIEQSRAVAEAVEACDRLQRRPGRGQRMSLAVVDHLDAMLDRAQQPIGARERIGGFRIDPPSRSKGRQRLQRGAPPQFELAAAMDELMRLCEELDLADAAAAALQVVAGTERLPFVKMVADLGRQRVDFRDRAEIERAAPDERVDRLQEMAAHLSIAGGAARADEGCPLPGERARFIMADGGVDREHDRGDLGRRAEAEVDAEGIAMLGALLQQLDHALGDPHRRLAGLVAGAARERGGVEQEYEVDVRRVIELAPALLAHGDHGEAARRLAGAALGDCGGDRPLERAIGQIGQLGAYSLQRQQPGEVADRQRQRRATAFPPQRGHRIFLARLGAGGAQRSFDIAGSDRLRSGAAAFQLEPEEGGVR
jgi:hypothetical protein